MKTYYLLGITLLIFNFNLQAQFTCDFEECETGGTSDCNDVWTDWGCGGGPGCSIMCAEGGYTGDWSGMIPGDGTTDAILDLGNKIFDNWGLEFWMFVPSGKEAYLNLQGQVPISSGEWIVGNIHFNQDLTNPGVGLIDDSALGQINFNFPHDEWFRVVMNFDILSGISLATWQFNVDGTDVIPFGTPFTNEDGDSPTSLGGINFFSVSTNNELYLDDFNYIDDFIDTEPIPGPFTDDMETYTDGEAIFGGWWTSWGCGEELGCALEATSAQAHSGNLSGLVPGDNSTSPDLELGNQTSGKWALEFYLYIPENKEGYYNLQGTVPIGAGEWIVGNIFFNHDLQTPGVGFIDDSALGNVEFNFPHEEWFSVIMNVDLTDGMNNGTWQYIVNGVEVIPTGTPFTNYSGDIPASLGGLSFFSLSSDHELYVDDFNYINGEILGVNNSTAVNFSIYPNPSNDIVNITSEESIKTVKIYNLLGKIVYEKENIDKINISELSKGLYFIEVHTEKGKSVQKFIKN